MFTVIYIVMKIWKTCGTFTSLITNKCTKFHPNSQYRVLLRNQLTYG